MQVFNVEELEGAEEEPVTHEALEEEVEMKFGSHQSMFFQPYTQSQYGGFDSYPLIPLEMIPDEGFVDPWGDIYEERIEDEEQQLLRGKDTSPRSMKEMSDSMEVVQPQANVTKMNDFRNFDVEIFDFEAIEPQMRGPDFLFHKRQRKPGEPFKTYPKVQQINTLPLKEIGNRLGLNERTVDHMTELELTHFQVNMFSPFILKQKLTQPCIWI